MQTTQQIKVCLPLLRAVESQLESDARHRNGRAPTRCDSLCHWALSQHPDAKSATRPRPLLCRLALQQRGLFHQRRQWLKEPMRRIRHHHSR